MTHSSHLLMLCLTPLCPSQYEPSGSSRSQAPQIFMLLEMNRTMRSFVCFSDAEPGEVKK